MRSGRPEWMATDKLTTEQSSVWDRMDSVSRTGHLCSSTAWSRMVAASDGSPPTFFALLEGGVPVAGLMGDIMPKGVPAKYDIEQVLSDGGGHWEPDEVMMPCLTGTTRSGDICDIRLEPSCTRALELTSQLFQEFASYGASTAAATALLHLPADSLLTDAASSAGFVGGVIDSSYYMDVASFETFDDYLDCFQGHRRRVIRAERRRLVDIEAVTFRVAPLSEHVDDFVRLAVLNQSKYAQLDEDHGSRIRDRAWETVKVFGVHAEILLMYLDDNVVGMAHFIELDHQIFTRISGYDPDAVPSQFAPYFNLCYYELIELAIRRDVRRIIYGGSLGETKLSRGCAVEGRQLLIHEPSSAVVARLAVLSSMHDSSSA